MVPVDHGSTVPTRLVLVKHVNPFRRSRPTEDDRDGCPSLVGSSEGQDSVVRGLGLSSRWFLRWCSG